MPDKQEKLLSADDLKRYAQDLRDGASADIWFDAHHYGDKAAEERIVQTQAAMNALAGHIDHQAELRQAAESSVSSMSAVELLKGIKAYEEMPPAEALRRIAEDLPQDLARLVADHMFPAVDGSSERSMPAKTKRALNLAEPLLHERARALFGQDEVPGQSGYAKWALAHAAVRDAIAPEKTPANDRTSPRQKPHGP
jgi:hypothetical protein